MSTFAIAALAFLAAGIVATLATLGARVLYTLANDPWG